MKTSPINVLSTIPFEDELVREIQKVSPLIQYSQHITRNPDEFPPALISQAEVLYTNIAIPEPEKAPNLKWLQFHWAGIEFALDKPLLKEPGITLRRSAARQPQIAEYVLTAFLMIAHKFPEMGEFQRRAEWPKDKWDRFRRLNCAAARSGSLVTAALDARSLGCCSPSTSPFWHRKPM